MFLVTLEPLLLVESCVGCWDFKTLQDVSPVCLGVAGGKVRTRLPEACPSFHGSVGPQLEATVVGPKLP